MNEPPCSEAAIFDAALQISANERGAFLDRACANNPSLRKRIDALLAAAEKTSNFLEPPISHADEKLTTPCRTEQPGDVIGRYKLLQKIGEGGCGVVYMAEQQVPVCRLVALKVIKLGMDVQGVVARFEAERQALAMMDHPNIAKVFDAGATETGRPYFVMELVRGTKMTEYCDQENLPTVARLQLFTKVCSAIQHAHQKGIIHRDIKPSNILVTLHDGVPVPKVIDFGIAKATSDQRLTDKTLFTAFEQFMGTPAYMSPEQAELSGLDVDTRSDIYSLGVLLYELLTSRTPFDAKELLAAGLDGMRRRICEEEPKPPSSRLQTLCEADQTEIAKRRQVEPNKLTSLLRGDLDWIVMKTLEKDRNRRYDSATALAQDIARHLSSQPIIARPPTTFYRIGKLFRRHRLAFVSGTAVILTLVIATALLTAMYLRERAARHTAAQEKLRADENAAVANTISEFLATDLFAAPTENGWFESVFKPPPGSSVLAGLERVAESIGEKFKDRPLIEAKIRQAIGDAYSSADVNRPLYAIPQYERAVALRRLHLGSNDTSTLHSMKSVALAWKSAGQYSNAFALGADILRIMTDARGATNDEVVMFKSLLATTYQEAGKIDEAIPLFEEVNATLKADTPAIWTKYNRDLALLLEKAGRSQEAVARWREAITFWEQREGPFSRQVATGLSDLGSFHLRQSEFTEAEAALRRALKIQDELQPDSWVTANTRSLLGAALLGQKRLPDAERILTDGLAGMQKHAEQIPRDRKDRIANTMNRLVEIYTAWDKPQQTLEWKAKLRRFEQSLTETNAPAGKELSR